MRQIAWNFQNKRKYFDFIYIAETLNGKKKIKLIYTSVNKYSQHDKQSTIVKKAEEKSDLN